MDTLTYKRDLEHVLERLRALYSKETPSGILASFAVPTVALRTFAAQHDEGFCAYPEPEERVLFWDRYLSERSALEDDSIPSAYLSELDQGLYGGLLGGDVQFMCHPENGWISSMVPPLLQTWSDFDQLAFDSAHPWWARYARQLEGFVRAAEGRFGISHFILINGLNFVFELLGATRTYLSLSEHPDRVEQAVDLAFELNTTVQKRFFEAVPLLRRGTCSNMVQWIPGRVVSESVDPFHMTSTAYFERWGREPVERMLAQFDGGVLHIHGNGRHLLDAVSSVRGLKAVYLGDDRGFPAAFEVLPALRRRVGDLPLVVGVSWAPFMEALENHGLVGGVFYQVSDAPVLLRPIGRWSR